MGLGGRGTRSRAGSDPTGGRRQCLLGDIGALQASTAERGGSFPPNRQRIVLTSSRTCDELSTGESFSFLDILPVVEPAGPSAPAFPSSWADACAAPAGRLLGGMRFSDATEPPDGVLRSASDSLRRGGVGKFQGWGVSPDCTEEVEKRTTRAGEISAIGGMKKGS